MIKIEKLLPDIYYKESRDFKLFSKLLEIVVNSSDLNIKNMVNILNPELTKDSFLDILATALNYKPKNNFSNDELRIILNNYLYLIRHRGSKEGIQHAISLALRLNDSIGEYTLNITNFPEDFTDRDYSRSYIITVLVSEEVNINYLREFLEIVKPVGYTFQIELDASSRDHFSTIQPTVQIIKQDKHKIDSAEHIYDLGYVPSSDEYGDYIEIGREEIQGDLEQDE